METDIDSLVAFAGHGLTQFGEKSCLIHRQSTEDDRIAVIPGHALLS
jgi:hypothetical protein